MFFQGPYEYMKVCDAESNLQMLFLLKIFFRNAIDTQATNTVFQ